MTPPVRVVKLGGSLLDWPELPFRLRAWFVAQSPAANVLIVGGGAVVDALRAGDRAQHLPAETMHRLAVQAMSLSAEILAELLPEARLAQSIEDRSWAIAASLQILDVATFVREDAAHADALPETWEVTSDSIAARVASALGAAELVLLKSALPAGETSLRSWSQAAYVDRYFPQAARSLAVRCVNLRDPAFAQTTATGH